VEALKGLRADRYQTFVIDALTAQRRRGRWYAIARSNALYCLEAQQDEMYHILAHFRSFPENYTHFSIGTRTSRDMSYFAEYITLNVFRTLVDGPYKDRFELVQRAGSFGWLCPGIEF